MPRKNRTNRNRRTQTSKVWRFDRLIYRAVTTVPGSVSHNGGNH